MSNEAKKAKMIAAIAREKEFILSVAERTGENLDTITRMVREEIAAHMSLNMDFDIAVTCVLKCVYEFISFPTITMTPRWIAINRRSKAYFSMLEFKK